MCDPNHKREPKYLLRGFEQAVLPLIARKLPWWLTPDHLTVTGLVACIGICICYAYSGAQPVLLLVACVLFVVNWFGDSLDGTLARVRRIERPRYGYYLDHVVDMISAAAVCVGLGLSPHMSLGTATAALIVYYLLSINVFLETLVLRSFQYGYGYVGPTEMRIVLICLSVGLYLGVNPRVNVLGWNLALLDVLGWVAGLVGLGMLCARVLRNLRTLSELDPPNVRKPPVQE